MVYSNFAKSILYFDPNNCRIKRTVHCCIDHYGVKLNSDKYMSLGALMIQEYPSGVYQPFTTPPDTNIRLIQPSLDILYSLFASTKILTLEVLLPPSGNPTNITILDDPIFSIPYIYQVTRHPPYQTNLLCILAETSIW